jgi:predicted dehydrogenase
MTTPIRIGIVGLGNAGSHHAKYLLEGAVPDAVLAAVCDSGASPERIEAVIAASKGSLAREAVFKDAAAMYASGRIDAVLIATPHPVHAQTAVAAFAAGLHVLVEKPIASHIRDARLINQAAERAGTVFGIMFSMRGFPLYRSIKGLISGGELGAIRRVGWNATDWYRTQSYFQQSCWRGTWSGEGGGLLINQAPHTIDLLQWLCGVPERLVADCGFGRHHDIETEDEAAALLRFPGGATGTFVVSTSEAPGANRLEIAGDRGLLVAEKRSLTFWRTREPLSTFTRTCPSPFGVPETWRIEIPLPGEDVYNVSVTRDFVQAIVRGDGQQLSPGIEGIRSLQISNGMLMSAWTGGWVDLPLDETSFMAEFERRAAASSPAVRPLQSGPVVDLAQSFHR